MAMTPEQALAQLDEVASKYHGTRQDHQILLQSIAVLRDALLELQGHRNRLAQAPAGVPVYRVAESSDTDGSYG